MHTRNDKLRRKDSRPEVISEKEELAGDDEENSINISLSGDPSKKLKPTTIEKPKTNKVSQDNFDHLENESDTTVPKTKICCN